MRKTIDWDTLFLNMAFTVAEKSKDDSTQCGAVLVDKRNRVLSTGFNGPPPQMNDELVPWNSRPQKYAFIIHAEENALWYGSEFGTARVSGSTLYCTHYPCADCILRLMRSDVYRVVIPVCHAAYPLSKYQVEPDTIIEAMKYPKLIIEKVIYLEKDK